MIGQIELLLKSRIGLDAASIGRSAVEYAVRARMSACRMPDLASYVRCLEGSEEEQQALVDVVVVPETWFFRSREAFDAMTDIALTRYRRDGRPLRLASLPCSTGEEPYSMAMALLDAGLSPAMFHVDGFDVSTRAIAAARTAIYGRNSFRGEDIGFRDRHFETVQTGFRVLEAVRRQVSFAPGNLVDPVRSPILARYDIIFCRNVLIYFDRPTQDVVIRTLFHALAADGILFVSASEAALPGRQGFSAMRLPMAAAFRKGDPVAQPVPDAGPPPRPARTRAKQPRVVPVVAARPRADRPAPKKAPEPSADDTAAKLREVQRLADAGRIPEAIRLGRECLRDNGGSPQIFYLLGLLSDASGDPEEARRCYRKTLYLDPAHSEALAHLALLHEKQGDNGKAKALNARLSRQAPVR